MRLKLFNAVCRTLPRCYWAILLGDSDWPHFKRQHDFLSSSSIRVHEWFENDKLQGENREMKEQCRVKKAMDWIERALLMGYRHGTGGDDGLCHLE